MIDSGVALSTVVYGSSMGAGLGFSFLVIRWLANFIAGRIDTKEAHLDATARELIEGLRMEIGRLSNECKDLRKAVAVHGKELAECRRKHAESESEVMQLKAMLQGYGDAREKAQMIIAADHASGRKK